MKKHAYALRFRKQRCWKEFWKRFQKQNFFETLLCGRVRRKPNESTGRVWTCETFENEETVLDRLSVDDKVIVSFFKRKRINVDRRERHEKARVEEDMLLRFLWNENGEVWKRSSVGGGGRDLRPGHTVKFFLQRCTQQDFDFGVSHDAIGLFCILGIELELQ